MKEVIQMPRFNFINIIDLYGYKLFDNIQLPIGIDKELLINCIMDECAEFEPLYTDEKLLTLKIQTFFKKNFETFSRIYDICKLEYNPIENYDRNEEWQDGVNFNRSENNTMDYNTDDVNKVSAYDSNTYTNNTMNNVVYTHNNDTTNSGNENTSHAGRTHGNIGVTTTQQMLDSELDIRPKLNIYKYIAEAFYAEFMLYYQ